MEILTPRLVLRLQQRGDVGECVFELYDRDSNNLIGACGYHTWYPQHARAEIGYHLAEGYRGIGLMSEAMPDILQFGFTEMELNRIEAQIEPHNLPSIRLIRKMGFQFEGYLRQNFKSAQKFEDSCLYARLKEYPPLEEKVR